MKTNTKRSLIIFFKLILIFIFATSISFFTLLLFGPLFFRDIQLDNLENKSNFITITLTAFTILTIVIMKKFISKGRHLPFAETEFKEKCDICNNKILNSRKYGFDINNKFDNMSTPKILCEQCLKTQWITELEKNKIHFISFKPRKRRNAYLFIPMKDSHNWAFTKEQKTEFTKLVNKINDKCDLCNSKAITVYLPNINDLTITNVNSKSVSKHYYCEKHFVTEMINSFIKNKTMIDIINIPYDKKGVYIPTDY